MHTEDAVTPRSFGTAHITFAFIVALHTVLRTALVVTTCVTTRVLRLSQAGLSQVGLLSTDPYIIRIRVNTLVYTLYIPNWAVVYAFSDSTRKAYTARSTKH